jgi:hypothetical protein
LVNIEDLIDDDINPITSPDSTLLKNKKPLILTFDNVSYKSNYKNTGEVDKIIVDRNNNIATYTTKRSIQDRVQYDNEFMVILESFIAEHPSFSYNNARGIIFLTGQDGILGYNTNQKNASHKYERKKVVEVIFKLKSLGWKFGSNNYIYQSDDSFDDLSFAKNLSLWNQEVKPLIGSTNYYAYPVGLYNKDNTFRQDLLIRNNFKYFFSNNEDKLYWKNGNTHHISRIPINQQSLSSQNNTLLQLFTNNQLNSLIT